MDRLEKKGYTLLIVDDESIEREAIKFILDKADLPELTIIEASNGQEAISETALHEPDIILMDIQMPGLNGIEASKVIKKIASHTKIIFLTAYNQFDYAHEAIKLGVDEFIIKPSSNERFLQAIKNTIEQIEALQLMDEKREEMENKLQKVSKYLENEFVMALITGNINEEQTKEYLDFHGINERNAMGAAVHLDISAEFLPSNMQRQMMKKRFLEKIQEKANTFLARYYGIIVKDYIYILVFGESVNDLFQVQQLIRKTIIEVSDHFAGKHHMYSDFYIGDPYNEVAEVWKSFAKAKSGCNKKTGNKVVQSKEVVDILVNGILNHKEEVINEECEKFDELFEDFELEKLRYKLHELTILIKDGLANHDAFELDSDLDLFNQIMKIENLGQAKRRLRNICYDLMEKVISMKVDKSSLIMDKIITYINVHYNENITLEQLSEISGRSTYYLSKLFKKQVEMNFVDYLAFIRMKVGKRLLRNPEYSIKEIAYEIGYGDPNYFTRVFKKYENVTPTEYRSLYMVKERDGESGEEE